MPMQALVGNFHRRLSLLCVGWAGFQIVFAYALGGNRQIAYPVAIACVIVTMALWFVLPAVARRHPMKTISTRYYGVLRVIMMPAFFIAFFFPFLFYWLSKDKFHFGVVILLGITAAVSTVLAYKLYGESMYKFLMRSQK
jgi:hypothetical protein